MDRLSSHSLFHFTQSQSNLKSILENGFRFSLIAEKIPNSKLMYTVPAVCFCNIPLSSISEHVDWYGYYGIGLKPAFCKSIGATPVCYVHSASPFLPSTRKQETLNQSMLTPFLKRIAGKQKKYNCHKYHWKDFYNEKEWRAIKKGDCNIWSMDNLDDLYQKREDLKTGMQYTYAKIQNLSFDGDIEYIILQKHDEVPDFVNWLSGHYNDLIPKVITVDRILKDF